MTGEHRIILSKDPQSVRIDTDRSTLCLYHKSFSPPRNELWTYVEWSEFREHPRSWLNGVKLLVIVGLNSIITPGNRTHMAFEVLFNNSQSLPKISIDRTLFTVDPWRAWFHFGITGSKYRDYTYSYIAESNYNAFVEKIREDNPFSLEEIQTWGKGVARSDYQQFGCIETTIIETPAAVHAEYAQPEIRMLRARENHQGHRS